MSIVRYTIYWLHLMKDRVFGIFTSGNRIIATNKYMDAWIYLAALVYGVAIIRTASRENKYLLIFLGIATFYLLVLLYENYSTYKGTGRPSLAVQGRYILAVLPLFYLAGNHYIEKLLARRRPLVQGLFVLITVIIFAVSALPTYLHKSTPAWHQHYAKTSSQKIVLGI